MRKFINSEAMQHSMKLLQLGAKVQQIDSKMCYVEFCIDGCKLEYVYNINSKGQYFLERIKPYPLPLKVFTLEKDVIESITIDMKQFKDAIKSNNISGFLEIGVKLNIVLKKFEDLFLYYNIPKTEVDEIASVITTLENKIDKVQNKSKRICFFKEPENLRVDKK